MGIVTMQAAKTLGIQITLLCELLSNLYYDSTMKDKIFCGIAIVQMDGELSHCGLAHKSFRSPSSAKVPQMVLVLFPSVPNYPRSFLQF